MPKFDIPTISFAFVLSRDTPFTIHDEHRNQAIIEAIPELKEIQNARRGSENWYYGNGDAIGHHVFPKGTKMIVSRIYIRQGAGQFDSVTLRAKLGKKSVRFWVKLDEFNLIEYEPA